MKHTYHGSRAVGDGVDCLTNVLPIVVQLDLYNLYRMIGGNRRRTADIHTSGAQYSNMRQKTHGRVLALDILLESGRLIFLLPELNQTMALRARWR